MDWRGYVIWRNVQVDRQAIGKWNWTSSATNLTRSTQRTWSPVSTLISWKIRDQRFAKTFDANLRFIFTKWFTWSDASRPIDQVAILPRRPMGGDALVGERAQSASGLSWRSAPMFAREGSAQKRDYRPAPRATGRTARDLRLLRYRGLVARSPVADKSRHSCALQD